VAREVDDERPVPQHLIALRLARSSSQHSGDARHQLARAEGLGDVVVGAELEAEHAVELFVAAGQKDDRHFAPRSNLPAHGQAVVLRHQDIEHDQLGRARLELAQRLSAILGLGDLVRSALERVAHHLAQVAVVVGDQDARHALFLSAVGAARPCPPPPAPALHNCAVSLAPSDRSHCMFVR
jgi:hypothetical protein